jgi:hypothetical protein
MDLEQVFANGVICGLISAKTDLPVVEVLVSGDLASLMQFAELTIFDHELSALMKKIHEDGNEQ